MGSYDTTINIDLRLRSRGVTIKLVVVDKQITLPPRFQIIVLVYYISLPDDRDFLFKPTIKAVSLYTYLVDDSFYLVIARNNINALVVISRYLRLGTMSEIDYNNCYLATSQDTAELALSLATTGIKDSWNNKELLATVRSRRPTLYAILLLASASEIALLLKASISETVPISLPIEIRPLLKPLVATYKTRLSNSVTIYRSSGSPATKAFRKVVKDYLQLQKDYGSFAKLDERYQIRIPLRSDQESYIPTKVRIYPLGNKDKEVVNRVFDKLYT